MLIGGAAQLQPNGEKAQIDYIDIICYDDRDKPVAKYPSSAPDRFATVQNQPTLLQNGAFPPAAGPQTKGAKKEAPIKPAGYNGDVTGSGSVADTGSNDGSSSATTPTPNNNTPHNNNTATFGDEKKPSGSIPTLAIHDSLFVLSVGVFAWVFL